MFFFRILYIFFFVFRYATIIYATLIPCNSHIHHRDPEYRILISPHLSSLETGYGPLLLPLGCLKFAQDKAGNRQKMVGPPATLVRRGFRSVGFLDMGTFPGKGAPSRTRFLRFLPDGGRENLSSVDR